MLYIYQTVANCSDSFAYFVIISYHLQASDIFKYLDIFLFYIIKKV